MMTLDNLVTVALPLLSVLWKAAWQGGLALLLALLICRVWARLPGAWQSVLWRLAFAKLLLTLIPLGPVPLPLVVLPATPQAARYGAAPAALVITPTPVLHTPALLTESPVAPPPAPSLLQVFLVALASLYILGVLTNLGRAFASLLHLRCLRRAATAVAPDIQRVADDVARTLNLRRSTTVRIAPSLSAPLLMPGAILLPALTWEKDALRLVLAHELAHVRRRDLIWDALSTLARALFFFHPLVLWAWREERIARELAADALALAVTHAPAAEYGKLLLSLSVAPRRADFAGAVGAMESGTSLQRRLLALKGNTLMTRRQSLALLIATPLTLAAFIVPWRITRAKPVASPPTASLVTARPNPSSMPRGPLNIKGRITDLRGTPIGQLSVTLWALYPRTAAARYERVASTGQNLTTETNGTFVFTGLPAGQYVIMVKSNHHTWPGTFVRVPLKKGSSPYVAINLGKGTLVSGRVTDRKTGEPGRGVSVNAEVPALVSASGSLVPHVDRDTTDALGRYSVRIPVGTSIVGVDRFGPPTAPDMQEEQRGKIVTTRNDDRKARDFTVMRAPLVTFMDKNSRPVSNATVMLYTLEPKKHYGNYQLQTESDGTIRLRYFPKGTFTATKDDLQAAGTFEVKPDGSLFLTEGATADKAPRVEPTGQARIMMTNQAPAAFIGKVVNEAGEPIVDARVRVAEIDPATKYGRRDRIARSQQDGTFRVPLSLNGEFYPYVRAEGYNQVDVSHNTKFVPQRGEIKDLGTITLVKADGVLTGRILDDKSKPRAGAIVVAEGDKTNLSAALSDTQGNFRIVNLVEGESLKITVCARGVVSDSGMAGFQSNDIWYRRGIKAGQSNLQVTLRRAEKDKVLPASAR